MIKTDPFLPRAEPKIEKQSRRSFDCILIFIISFSGMRSSFDSQEYGVSYSQTIMTLPALTTLPTRILLYYDETNILRSTKLHAQSLSVKYKYIYIIMIWKILYTYINYTYKNNRITKYIHRKFIMKKIHMYKSDYMPVFIFTMLTFFARIFQQNGNSLDDKKWSAI
jgi:hypothetical protein